MKIFRNEQLGDLPEFLAACVHDDLDPREYDITEASPWICPYFNIAEGLLDQTEDETYSDNGERPDMAFLESVQNILNIVIDRRNQDGTGWFIDTKKKVNIPENWKELME